MKIQHAKHLFNFKELKVSINFCVVRQTDGIARKRKLKKEKAVEKLAVE